MAKCKVILSFAKTFCDQKAIYKVRTSCLAGHTEITPMCSEHAKGVERGVLNCSPCHVIGDYLYVTLDRLEPIKDQKRL